MSWTAKTSATSTYYPISYYWGDVNPNANFTNCMANCTTYAYGRELEAGRPAPVTVIRNANLWHTVVNTSGGWELLTYTQGMELEAGDIVEYASNHVAVCETSGSSPTLSGSWYTDDNGKSSGSRSTSVMGSTLSDVCNWMITNYPSRYWHNNRSITSESGAGYTEYPTYVLRYTGEEPTTRYTLSYRVSPDGSGTITGSPQGSYEAGTSITLTATANAGYTFDHWLRTGGGTITDATFTRNMTYDRDYTAYFVEDETTIIACTMAIKKKKGQINEITILV